MRRLTELTVVVAALGGGAADAARHPPLWTVDELAAFHITGMRVRVDGYLVSYFNGGSLAYSLICAERNASTGSIECGTNIARIDSPKFHVELHGSEPQRVILTGRYSTTGPNGGELTQAKVERVLPGRCQIVVSVRLGSPPAETRL